MIALRQTATIREKGSPSARQARQDHHRNTSDVAPVGEGVSELRIHYGPGYRMYFRQRGNLLVMLPCRGDKGTQARDTETAKKLAKEWSVQGD